jgi:serine protein kinase
MNEEPLHLIPQRFRADVEAELNTNREEDEERVRIEGELDPFCRFMYYQRLKKYDGDWSRVVQDVRVKRVLLSEKDRVGIGTFQPKDEKNQDATELTGDINYRKIAEYRSRPFLRSRAIVLLLLPTGPCSNSTRRSMP